MDWISELMKSENMQNELMSMNDYMGILTEFPKREIRPTYSFFKDMIDYFGKDEDGDFKLFKMQHKDAPAVYGQQETKKMIYQNLIDFSEEGMNNKFILLVGPNGSSKSSLVKKIMKGAELYSKEEEGALYTFSWIFPIDQYIKGGLGLTSKTSEKVSSYAYLEDKEISAILTSELKDHPILLIPKEHRQKLIDDLLKDEPETLESIQKSYMYEGDLSNKNNQIYEALLKNYKGDHGEVLKHIRVERFYISRHYSKSAVTIEPQLHVDARIQQITMDKRLASLPPSLQSLNLFSLQGEVVLANRGILEYSDLLKRPLDTYKYLLMTMESSNINLQGIVTQLDIFFLGTSNEIHLEAFKQHPDYKSFKGRINFVKVPYLLNYNDEQNIYKEQISALKNRTQFEPHALHVLSLFAVLTRLRACLNHNYEDKKLAKIVTGLGPIEKASLLADREIPERLDSESKQLLDHGYNLISNEFKNDFVYEGKFGISPREMKKCIYELSASYENITIVEILEYLDLLMGKKDEIDFFALEPKGDYHNPARILVILQNYAIDLFDNELRSSLGLVDDRSYEEYIQKYISNINSLNKGEKVKNTVTGKYEACDEYFIKEFEKNIRLTEDANKYRSHLLSKLGAYSLDNPGKDIVYTDIFTEIVKRLRQSFRDEQNKILTKIENNLIFFQSEIKGEKIDHNPLNESNRELIEGVVKNLVNKFNYSETAAVNVLKYFFEKKHS